MNKLLDVVTMTNAKIEMYEIALKEIATGKGILSDRGASPQTIAKAVLDTAWEMEND